MGETTAALPSAWPAPAKLNLMLHIVGRRADGYHELQTVFQLLDLCDTISIELRDDGRIERPSGACGVAPEDDLVVRAARTLQARTGTEQGAGITVRKRIPLGGGLGGGSSNAATTLIALNALWRTGLGLDELATLGANLGADVPVFVKGRSAWAQGIGDRLTPLELPPAWYVIIHPGIAVPTREVFQTPELTRNSPVMTIPGFFASGGRNDFEPVVRVRYPSVAAALDWLAQFAPARLTGTGACVFAQFATAAAAERVAARVPDEWASFVARGVDESPLQAKLRCWGVAKW
ncbi:MAG TPA: 4-(cytidine 5'-diphospho)-2-C-methyl-D-erythritol kinase [Steroidobacteraceae bacterium]|nr:4-(cytidine 5'-diphospho)-2-C-methyl-D-erythritol kinase [Steroidobacteraceae bacterium]HRX89932.1 4-(cytidine 5'-diphospho)-2-C-methyl-D-erythritol kinase [Steroidobacteraceae bacterium]